MRERLQSVGQAQDDLYRPACSPSRMVKYRTAGDELSSVTSEACNAKLGHVRQPAAPFWELSSHQEHLRFR